LGNTFLGRLGFLGRRPKDFLQSLRPKKKYNNFFLKKSIKKYNTKKKYNTFFRS